MITHIISFEYMMSRFSNNYVFKKLCFCLELRYCNWYFQFILIWPTTSRLQNVFLQTLCFTQKYLNVEKNIHRAFIL